MHLNVTYKNSWNRKQNKVGVTLDSELYMRKLVLTYAISGNVVGGFETHAYADDTQLTV